MRWHIFPHKLAVLTAILILCFYYLFLLVSLPQPSGYQQNGPIHVSGPLWNEMGQLVFYSFVPYFRCIFGVYAVHIFLIKMPHKTDMPDSLYKACQPSSTTELFATEQVNQSLNLKDSLTGGRTCCRIPRNWQRSQAVTKQTVDEIYDIRFCIVSDHIMFIVIFY